jgi:hypothetical protein
MPGMPRALEVNRRKEGTEMVLGVRKDQTPKESCEQAYRNFSARKDHLRETAWRFLEDVRRRMSAGAPEAERIVNLIIRDWQSVRPHTRAGKIGYDPFSQATETFDPSRWRDVDYAAGLHLALRDCGESFEAAQTLYNRLSPDERRELFPDGGLKP